MKKFYEEAEIKITIFDSEGVITASAGETESTSEEDELPILPA